MLYADSHSLPIHARAVAEALAGAAGSSFQLGLEGQGAFEHGRAAVDSVHFLVRSGTTSITSLCAVSVAS